MSMDQRIIDEAKRITTEWAQDMRDTVERNVRAKGVVGTGQFARSIAHRTADEGDANMRVELSFDRAGRFADMGAGSMYTKGVYQGRESRTDRLSGGAMRSEALMGRKGNKAYSRAAYGRISGLMNLLANMYVEEVPTGIANTITDEQSSQG